MPFPHLQLVSIERGRAKLSGGGEESPEVKENKKNRQAHVKKLRQKIGDFTSYWQRAQAERAEKGLPPIVGGIPFLLKIPERNEELLLRLEKAFGVQIVAQFGEGFLLVASEDISLTAFQELMIYSLLRHQKQMLPPCVSLMPESKKLIGCFNQLLIRKARDPFYPAMTLQTG
jgi:hypothetical protein